MVYVARHADEQFHIPATCHPSRLNHSAGKTTEGASPGAESAVSCVQTSGGQLTGHSAS
jgi:catabolite regulation protein CreA